MRRRHEELREHPLALQIDDLPRFAERESHRIVVRGKRVGADEAVLLVHAADLALDDPRRLVLTFALVGLGADDEALVFDRLRNLCRLDVRKAAEQGTEKRHHLPPDFCARGEVTPRA